MNKLLVVVDVQKDFYHPNGSLYVKDSECLPEKIAKIIPMFDDVVFTVDFHPFNHCSFVDNGGQWPIHCVAYTEGASLPNEFIPFVDYIHNNYCRNIVTKGSNSDSEEYGANPINIIISTKIDISDDTEVVFCGIAGDYCVLHTIENFIKLFPNVKTSVYMDAITSIDDGTKLINFINKNNIHHFSL